MNLFGKKKTENWIIKLFKITDHETAKRFDMGSCTLSAIDSISEYTNLRATDFDINYRDSRKTLKGFKKTLKDQKEIVYSFVGFDSEKTRTYFTIQNPMLNWTEQPENSTVNICIQIAGEIVEKEPIEQIAEKLIKQYEFEYGYITKLSSSYNSVTERKVKKSLFSSSVDVNEIDLAWSFHAVGILDGFIKSIYPVNYLNKSHLIDISTKEVISRSGKTTNLNDNIFKWVLNPEEFENVKTHKQIEKISIITSDLGFLKTEKAKIFHNKMKQKRML